MSVGGKQRVRVCKCACVWVVEERREGGGVPRWWLVRKDDGWWGRRGRLLRSSKLISQQMFLSAVKNGAATLISTAPLPPSPSLVSLQASPSAVNHTLQSISNTQSFTSRSPVFWQHLITAPASWFSAHIVYLALISLLPWKPALDYCSSPLIIYPFLCLALRGTAFRENYLSGWTISCRLLV